MSSCDIGLTVSQNFSFLFIAARLRILKSCGNAMQSSGDIGGNNTEMEIMENFVRSLVEGWRYQGWPG